MSGSIPETCDATERVLLSRLETWLPDAEVARRVAHDVAVTELRAVLTEIREFEAHSSTPLGVSDAVEVIECRLGEWEEM